MYNTLGIEEARRALYTKCNEQNQFYGSPCPDPLLRNQLYEAVFTLYYQRIITIENAVFLCDIADKKTLFFSID